MFTVLFSAENKLREKSMGAGPMSKDFFLEEAQFDDALVQVGVLMRRDNS